MYAQLTSLYRRALAKQTSAWLSNPIAAAVADVLSVLDTGEWATYGDVGELAGLSPQMVGRFVNTVSTAQGHRVLLVDGRCGEDFGWAEPRDESQRDVLEAGGLEFGPDGKADETAQVRLEDLRYRLEAAGLAKPVQTRAWLVRGSSVIGRDLVPELA